MTDSNMTVMVIVAHPDDSEFGSGGTVARWSAEGRRIIYVICTNGDKGTRDLQMTSERLTTIREQEEKDAARTLGVQEVVFLGHPDGGLEDTPEFRGELVHAIRKYKPDIVITSDPYRRPFQHRDHRMAGIVTLDACFPYARDRLFYPKDEAAGLSPHKVHEVYLYGTSEPDIFIDVSDTIAIKIEALRCHKSQLGDHMDTVEKFVRERSASCGEEHSYAYAEAFKRIEFPG